MDRGRLPAAGNARGLATVVTNAFPRSEGIPAIDGSRLRQNQMKIYTIGFTRKSARRFFDLLKQSGARRVIDVRIKNGSQLAGFAKKDDLSYFLGESCGMDCVHMPEMAPTKEMLDDYRKRRCDWKVYENRFIALMRERNIEEAIPKEILSDSRQLCSEDSPDRCHRRCVAEYLKRYWASIEIARLR